MDRALAAQLGKETVRILSKGAYDAPSGRRVDLRDAVERAVRGTVEYPPEQPAPDVRPPAPARMQIRVENATVLAVGRAMAATGSVAALNFASAESPGGGFLSGARAQEESIARSSALYAALEPCAMYAYHRARLDAMYTDYVIFTPDVPVFRTDHGDLLEEPWLLSIITSPAVHGPGVAMYAQHRLPDIPAAMTSRTHKVLQVAVAHGVQRIILGAWGCGAFGLDPVMMAGIFSDALHGPFRAAFSEVVFAITDWSPERRFIGPFEKVFSSWDDLPR
jgi:uncharacterized protein (TIGR02452 family)